MRALYLFVLVMHAAACTAPGSTAPSAAQPSAMQPSVTGPFAGLGIRYDGYYRDSRGEVIYLIRFFPEGRAVLINGTRDIEKDLPLFLTREIQSAPAQGLYNIKVDIRNDSLFFTTRPERGEISYRGKVMSGSTVRFHRHSHINGNDRLMEYIFYPDSAVSSP
ncbi:MAG: hypothetical protein IPL52_17505 [Flavobacteriales bacterium]|nr:hypothetical protein [Flavobacteriales bacterium]